MSFALAMLSLKLVFSNRSGTNSSNTHIFPVLLSLLSNPSPTHVLNLRPDHVLTHVRTRHNDKPYCNIHRGGSTVSLCDDCGACGNINYCVLSPCHINQPSQVALLSHQVVVMTPTMRTGMILLHKTPSRYSMDWVIIDM